MRAASWLLLPLLAGGCVLRGAPVSPYGRDVSLVGPHEPIQGELIAVGSDTIWVLQQSLLRAKPLSSERRIDVRRHTFGFRRTMKWMAIAGVSTGVALMVSCMSYESSGDGGGNSGGCLGVVPVTTLFFAAAGLLFGSINDYTTVHRFAPADSNLFRPYARYPQGLPDSIRVHNFKR